MHSHEIHPSLLESGRRAQTSKRAIFIVRPISVCLNSEDVAETGW